MAMAAAAAGPDEAHRRSPRSPYASSEPPAAGAPSQLATSDMLVAHVVAGVHQDDASTDSEAGGDLPDLPVVPVPGARGRGGAWRCMPPSSRSSCGVTPMACLTGALHARALCSGGIGAAKTSRCSPLGGNSWICAVIPADSGSDNEGVGGLGEREAGQQGMDDEARAEEDDAPSVDSGASTAVPRSEPSISQ